MRTARPTRRHLEATAADLDFDALAEGGVFVVGDELAGIAALAEFDFEVYDLPEFDSTLYGLPEFEMSDLAPVLELHRGSDGALGEVA